MKNCWPLLALLFCAGCNRNDVEIVTKIGSIVSERTNAVLEKTPRLNNPLQAKLSKKERVKIRLESEKALANCNFEVFETERGVRIKGEVPDEACKSTALDLSRGTVGVEEVEDELTVVSKSSDSK